MRARAISKSLCSLYDLAVAGELLSEDFIRFIYHDGLLEGLDPRVALNILEVLRAYSSRGVQQILTVLDSDLPIHGVGTPEPARHPKPAFLPRCRRSSAPLD